MRKRGDMAIGWRLNYIHFAGISHSSRVKRDGPLLPYVSCLSRSFNHYQNENTWMFFLFVTRYSTCLSFFFLFFLLKINKVNRVCTKGVRKWHKIWRRGTRFPANQRLHLSPESGEQLIDSSQGSRFSLLHRFALSLFFSFNTHTY